MSVKKNIAVGLGLLLAMAGAGYWLLRPTGVRSVALDGRQRAMELLGAEIAKRCADCKVLVLANPFTEDSSFLNETKQYERVGLRGLRQGLGPRATVEAGVPEVQPEYLTNPQSFVVPPDSRTPLSFVILPSSVDRVADAHPACRVVVSLIGLPVGVEQLKIWGEGDPRSFALLLPDLRVLGPAAKAVEAFERGKLLAAVVEDSGGAGYLVVTRDNIADLVEHRPKLLGY